MTSGTITSGTRRYLSIGMICAICTALVMLLSALPVQTVRAQAAQIGYQAFYWNNASFTGTPVLSRNESQINFNWGGGSPDVNVVPLDNFSARFYANVNVSVAGNFVFRLGADDGARVAVDNTIVLDRFTPTGGFSQGTATVFLAAGAHQIIIDYFEATGNAGLLFDVTPQGGSLTGNPVTTAPTVTPFPGATTAPTIFTTPIPTGPIKGVVIVAKTNVRGGPGVNYPQVGEAFKDQVFIVLARNGDFGFQTWLLVDLGNGQRGWIARANLFPYNGDPATLPKSQEIIADPGAFNGSTTTTIVTGVARSDVVVRDRASLSGNRIGVIPRGQSFTIIALSRTNRAWVKVDLGDIKGWVYTPNITFTSGTLGSLPRE